MIILLLDPFLPFSGVEQPGLPDLEQKLTADNLRTWLAKLDQASPKETTVGLPRFTTTQSFDLTKELESMGMPSAFNDTSNLSGMNGMTNDLYVSDVLHKAFVKVDESGTEAAAITLVKVHSRSQSNSFIVDHPFIFLIRENGSGSILFIGRVIDPTK